MSDHPYPAVLMIKEFLKVGGITNEQARQCALILHDIQYKINQPEECTIDDTVVAMTEDEIWEHELYNTIKTQIINYKFS